MCPLQRKNRQIIILTLQYFEFDLNVIGWETKMCDNDYLFLL